MIDSSTLNNHSPDAVISFLLQASRIVCENIEPSHTINALLNLLDKEQELIKARVILLDENKKLRVQYAPTLDADAINKGVYELNEGITGHVFSTGEVALIEDVSMEPAYLSRIPSTIHLNAKKVSYIAVPIHQQNRVIGVLAAQRKDAELEKLKTDTRVLFIVASMIQQVLVIHQLINNKTQMLVKENQRLKQTLGQSTGQLKLIGEHTTFRKAYDLALKSALSDSSVLLNGESGTGKELFARLIHQSSTRKNSEFVAINCAAIPDNLLESELFGHEKGSFTGANHLRRGRFELADGGTLFLDEIGDMNFEAQTKLLRTLQERRIQRVGSEKDIAVDVRVIAATHKNLPALIKAGHFRLDLYYRLNVIPILLPSLRERASDIHLLINNFLLMHQNYKHQPIDIETNAVNRLSQYAWPGNIRQLGNVIERLCLFAENQLIRLVDVEDILNQEQSESDLTTYTADTSYAPSPAIETRPYQKIHYTDPQGIINAIRQNQGNKSRAAKQLGLTLRQLQYRIDKLEIKL
ncbi:MAG: sigma 54-interacting transcriptional regulator [Gammaproteobacteria bacterium]|nr:sigma 54-interacting transcriptional regulator [Gammaproteobacteria bacterium]